MAWWKGTPDDDGNWERDIMELRDRLIAEDPEFAERERAIEKRWARMLFKQFKEQADALGGLARSRGHIKFDS